MTRSEHAEERRLRRSARRTWWMSVAVCGGAMVFTACPSDDLFNTEFCRPGELECLPDGGVRVCGERGVGWIESTCAVDQVCIPGSCPTGGAGGAAGVGGQAGGGGAAGADGAPCTIDRCVDLKCTPGERFCDANNVFVYECDATGTSECYVETCAAPPTDGVCFEGQCVRTCGREQKDYLGCEYFAADLDNASVDCDGVPGGKFCDAASEQYSVVVSNTSTTRTAHVIITQGQLPEPAAPTTCVALDQIPLPANFVEAQVVPPKGVRVFNLPRRDVNGTVLAPLAYRIASNTEISVYQFNPLENVDVFSNDASVLLPTTSVDREYFAITRGQFSSSLRGFVTVVAFDPEPTVVTITPTALIAPGPGVEQGIAANTAHTFVMNRFDVLNIESTVLGSDLTGTHIIADKPVVAFSGHEAANAPTPLGRCLPEGRCEGGLRPCGQDLDCLGDIPCCADHLEEQLFPVVAWGTEVIGVRSYRRGQELDIWRVLAATDGTAVAVDPPGTAELPILDRGKWVEFEAEGDVVIRASAPVLLAQYFAGEQSRGAGTGDPDLVLVAPVRQLRDSYIFLAPDKYAEDFASIAVQNGSARLDGALLSDIALDLPGLVEVAVIADSGWTAYRIPINDGFHTLTCPGTCSVMVHGYDQYVSYGYPGGLNLFECRGDADCRPPRDVCRTDNFTCVECLEDLDCPDTEPLCNLDTFTCRLADP